MLGLALLFETPFVQADQVTLNPVADTSLIELAPNNNLGGADFFNVGTTGSGTRNRGLMLFDLAGIPAGSTILDAWMSLDMVRQPATDGEPSTMSLYRVLVPWGEGAQVPDPGSPGLGSPAQPGEATWLNRFAPNVPWSIPGGAPGVDFAVAASSSAFTYFMGDLVNFEPTPALVADLQFWLDHPHLNFGWLLMTDSETVPKTARGFASRESGAGPSLVIDFVPIPEPGTGALAALGLLCLAVTRVVLRTRGAPRP